jgi:hypothetical protein
MFVLVKRVYLLCKEAFPWAQAHYMMESVSSMDEQDRATMSQHMESLPFMIDAAGISLWRRARLYRVSWELVAGPAVSIGEPQGEGWSQYVVVELQGEFDPAGFLLSCWKLTPGEKIPTSTTSRPRDNPGNRPAGIWQCGSWELDRWKQDRHRYPPYVYRNRVGLFNETGNTVCPRSLKRM